MILFTVAPPFSRPSFISLLIRWSRKRRTGPWFCTSRKKNCVSRLMASSVSSAAGSVSVPSALVSAGGSPAVGAWSAGVLASGGGAGWLPEDSWSTSGCPTNEKNQSFGSIGRALRRANGTQTERENNTKKRLFLLCLPFVCMIDCRPVTLSPSASLDSTHSLQYEWRPLAQMPRPDAESRTESGPSISNAPRERVSPGDDN